MLRKSTVERKKDISKRSTIPKVNKGNPMIRALTGQTRKNIELRKLHKGPVPGKKGIWPQLEVLNFWVLKQEGSRKNLPKARPHGQEHQQPVKKIIKKQGKEHQLLAIGTGKRSSAAGPKGRCWTLFSCGAGERVNSKFPYEVRDVVFQFLESTRSGTPRKVDEGGISTVWAKAHEGLRPSGWGKGEFPEKVATPIRNVLKFSHSC